MITRSEVENYVERWYEAYGNGDVDLIARERLGLEPGFGFRTLAPRNWPEDEAAARKATEDFLGWLQDYRGWVEDYSVELHGNVASVWGTHCEEFGIEDQPKKLYRVRFTMTLLKDSTGAIRTILGHRDIQDFDETGVYLWDT